MVAGVVMVASASVAVAAGVDRGRRVAGRATASSAIVAADSSATMAIVAAAERDTATTLPTSSAMDVDGVSDSHIDRWVSRLTTSLKGDFEVSLARMGRYGNMIDAKLRARQMPHDLIYLAMIESEFNPNARSPAKAVGLWQFMKGTARRFGLKVGHGVDERKDPAAETDAALTYLSTLHDRFGSWYLAAAAYNSGEGTVTRALEKVTGRQTGTDADFFRILPALPKETQDYVPKLIASARIGQDPAEFGMMPAVNLAPLTAATPTRASRSVAHRAATRARLHHALPAHRAAHDRVDVGQRPHRAQPVSHRHERVHRRG
jgi:membrane-bound lytic murein transglycosylase D